MEYDEAEIAEFLGVEPQGSRLKGFIFDLRKQGLILRITLDTSHDHVSITIRHEEENSAVLGLSMTCRRVLLRAGADAREKFLSFDADYGSIKILDGTGHIVIGRSPCLFVTSILQSPKSECLLRQSWSLQALSGQFALPQELKTSQEIVSELLREADTRFPAAGQFLAAWHVDCECSGLDESNDMVADGAAANLLAAGWGERLVPELDSLLQLPDEQLNLFVAKYADGGPLDFTSPRETRSWLQGVRDRAKRIIENAK